jgi:hypothetical protein
MLNPSDPLVETAVFGEQVRQFLESDIGDFLVQKARQQSDSWKERLKDIDPWDEEKIIVAQMKIHVADLILVWLGEAIQEGLQARENLREQA